MGLKNNAYATVWKSKISNEVVNYHKNNDGNVTYAEVRLSISKKNKQTNLYETDFSGNVRFIGHALNKIKELNLEEMNRIKLLDVEVTNSYSAETQKLYHNYICWDFEPAGKIETQTPKVDVIENELQPLDVSEDTLPF